MKGYQIIEGHIIEADYIGNGQPPFLPPAISRHLADNKEWALRWPAASDQAEHVRTSVDIESQIGTR